jgi:hypothetical protein
VCLFGWGQKVTVSFPAAKGQRVCICVCLSYHTPTFVFIISYPPPPHAHTQPLIPPPLFCLFHHHIDTHTHTCTHTGKAVFESMGGEFGGGNCGARRMVPDAQGVAGACMCV